MNFTIYTLAFLLISTSIVGYGYIFDKFILKIKKFNLGYLGLLGIFVLTIFVYLANIVTPITANINLVIHIFGIFCFLFYIKNEFKINNNQFKLFFFLLIFSLFFIFTAKTHDDFEYYHFAYIYLINNEITQFGVGHFNNGFRVPSSIFYFSSLFYLPYLKHDLVHLGSIYFTLFINFVLLFKIINLRNNINYRFLVYLCFIGLIVSNIFFYRLGEHGTDRSAQILIILLFIEVLLLVNFEQNKNLIISIIIILVSLIISLKAFYLIYISLIVPILIYQKEKLNFIKKIFFLKSTYFAFLFFILVIFTYFINSGCLIYPLSISCLNVSWAIPINQVVDWNEYYQLWSKAGATPNFRVTNPEEYIQGFNWLPNWIDIYFFNKVSDYLFSIFFITLILFFYFYSKKKYKIKIPKYKLIYLFVILFFIEWFYNHPALRYGGYHLIALIVFIPLSIYLQNNYFNKKVFNKKLFILISIVLLISVSRNVGRIVKESKIYNYDFLAKPSYNRNFQNIKVYYLIKDMINCKSDCVKNSIKVKKIFNRNIFYR